MDINYTDKAVLRGLPLAGEPYYIMVLCPQHVDERIEVEVTEDAIIRILAG